MQPLKPKPVRQLIIAGSYAQYRDYLQRYNLHPRAARYISQAGDLRGYEPGEDEIVLVGTYLDNEAYLSFEYLNFVVRGPDAARPRAVAV